MQIRLPNASIDFKSLTLSYSCETASAPMAAVRYFQTKKNPRDATEYLFIMRATKTVHLPINGQKRVESDVLMRSKVSMQKDAETTEVDRTPRKATRKQKQKTRKTRGTVIAYLPCLLSSNSSGKKKMSSTKSCMGTCRCQM